MKGEDVGMESLRDQGVRVPAGNCQAASGPVTPQRLCATPRTRLLFYSYLIASPSSQKAFWVSLRGDAPHGPLPPEATSQQVTTHSVTRPSLSTAS